MAVCVVVMQGVFGSGVTFYLQSWCISVRGPLYSAMFNPLCTVITTVFAAVVLREELHVGRSLSLACIAWTPVHFSAHFCRGWSSDDTSFFCSFILSLLGAIAVIAGLYVVLWGKAGDGASKRGREPEHADDLEKTVTRSDSMLDAGDGIAEPLLR